MEKNFFILILFSGFIVSIYPSTGTCASTREEIEAEVEKQVEQHIEEIEQKKRDEANIKRFLEDLPDDKQVKEGMKKEKISAPQKINIVPGKKKN